MKNVVKNLSEELRGLGEHICCIYRDKKERNTAVVSFLLAGLKNNEKCLYVMDESTEAEIVRALQRAGVNVEECLRSKQLEFLRVEDTYLRDGYFDPERMMALIKQVEAAALAEGYRGLRGIAEASWSLRKLPGSEKQLEYEARLNELLPQSQISVMCLYSERKFPPKVLLDVIYMHPRVILHGQLCDNPNYIKPGEYLARMRGEVTPAVYERVKESIIDRVKLEKERQLAQERIKRDQEYLQLIVDRMPIGLIVWDRDFKVRTWNPAATKILGFTEEEVLGKHPYEFIVPKEVQLNIDEVWRRLLEGDLTAHSINENLTKDGRTIVCEWTNTPLKDAEGKVVGVLSMFQDVTERQRAEEALRASEERFRMLVETMNEGLGIIDENGVITYVNDKLCEMLGYSKEEMIGRRVVDFFDNESKRTFVENFARMKKGERRVFEVVRIRKDGQRVYTLTSGAPIFDAAGRFSGTFAVITDISERKKAEQALRESERKYRELADSITDVFYALDKDMRFTYWNRTCEKLTGISAKDVIGKHLLEVFPERENTMRAMKFYQQAIETGKPLTFENEYQTKDGKMVVLESYVYPTKDGISVFAKDITERLRIERELRESEERYRSLVEYSSDSIYMIDRELRYLFVNIELLRRLGLPREKVVGRTFGELHTAEETWEFAAKVREVFETGQVVLQEYYNEQSGRFFLRTLSPVRDPANGEIKAVTVASKDITELVKARQRLAVSEEQLRKIIDSTPDIIVVFDTNGKLVNCNQSFLKVFGFSREEALGKNFLDLIPVRNREKAKEDFKGILVSEALNNVERILVSKEGREFPVELSASIVKGAFNKPLFVVFTARDITERKELEKRLRETVYKMYGIDRGECYIIQSAETACRLFAQMVLHGVAGLCISRMKPEKLLEHGIPKEKIVLLSSVPVKEFETLDDLQKLGIRISDFLRENKESVIVLGGLEYLVNRWGFDAVYRFIQEKRFAIMEANANLLIAIDLATLSDRERAMLVSEIKVLGQ